MSLITILDWDDCTEDCIRGRTCAGCGHITKTWCNSGFESKCKGLYKNTSGKMCKVFIPSAGMLAEPIKFEHSK